MKKEKPLVTAVAFLMQNLTPLSYNAFLFLQTKKSSSVTKMISFTAQS